jgi:transmembrane sensor
VSIASKTDAAAIDAEAARWVARLDRAPLTPDENAVLDAWLAVDTRHAGAFARARAVSLRFDKARALAPGFETRASPPPPRVGPGVRLRHGVIGVALAASVAAAFLWWTPGPPVEPQHIVTARGEVRRVALADGSSLTLDTASAVELRFDARERRVALAHGEALFDVAKDAARPFTVAAAGVEFRAVGTSFSVRSEPGEKLRLFVREGVVQVTTGQGAALRAGANMAVEIDSERPPVARALTPAELQRRLAWERGQLSFNDDTLNDAVREFARYSALRIELDDAALGKRRIAGLFAASNPLGFAQAVALSLGLEVEQRDGGVRLRAKAQPAPRSR